MCLSFRGIKDVQVVVRKPHRCGWCSGSIPLRSQARARVYVLDGDLISDWMHLECYDAMNDSDRKATCDGWMPGDFERGIAA